MDPLITHHCRGRGAEPAAVVLLILLTACASTGHLTVTPDDPPHPCDEATVSLLRRRVEGERVHLEIQRERLSCRGANELTTEPLVEILISDAPPSCPIGQVALRSWDHGHGHEEPLKDFLATLDREHVAELAQALLYFADDAQALVIDCPAPGRADWLFVDSTPRGPYTKAQLFLGNALSVSRRHARVRFAGAPTEELPEPPPQVAAPAPPDEVPVCGVALPPATRQWFGARTSISILPGPNTKQTFVLGRTGAHVSLDIEGWESSGVKQKPPVLDWQCRHVARLAGTVREEGKVLVLSFTDATTPAPYELRCTPRTVKVASARAVKVPVPSKHEDCAAHRWSPAASARVRVLECAWVEMPSRPWLAEQLWLGAAPGVEHFTLEADDCEDPVDSLRQLAR